MEREQIIRMARECGFWLDGANQAMPMWVIKQEELERFAALVASAERERLTDAAMKAAEKAVDVAIALERDACIDLVAMYGGPVDLEAAIRARGSDAEKN